MARQRVILPRGRRRPNRSWAGVASTAVVNIPAASKVLLGSFSPTTSGDVTALRTVGYVSIASDNSGATEFQIGAFGMIVVSDTALALGITAIPGPITDIADDGWFTYLPFGFEELVLTQAGVRPNRMRHMPLDSRGKRIVEDGRAVAIVAENAHATHAFDLLFSVRMLSLIGSGQ